MTTPGKERRSRTPDRNIEVNSGRESRQAAHVYIMTIHATDDGNADCRRMANMTCQGAAGRKSLQALTGRSVARHKNTRAELLPFDNGDTILTTGLYLREEQILFLSDLLFVDAIPT